MSAVTEVAVGLAVVVLVVGSMIWLAKKGFFAPDTNEESQEERQELEESSGSQDFSIPFRKRARSWSGPYKMFVGSCVLLAVLVGYGAWDVMRTGAPASKYLTGEVRFAAIALVGVAGGVKLKAWFDSQIAYLTVEYERKGARDLIERVPYARTAVKNHGGRTYVQEVADSRLLGLFWRFRQVGEDRRLRGGEKPLDDVVTHQVPDHGKEVPGDHGYHVRTQEQGDIVLEGATSSADVTYSSPSSLSSERAVELREEKKRKDASLNATKATNAHLQKQIRSMEKKIENNEYRDREDLLEDFSRFKEMSSMRVEVEDTTERTNGQQPADEKANGKEAGA
ncbi:hypothetical protein [Halorubellus salinus]|uniref:hypothetical protein n=1 Tax=Halorubellus salinus TaxID=755309 RepID=UPI001D0834EC|nr:hypothetical protein [Halorubellus salinus]